MFIFTKNIKMKTMKSISLIIFLMLSITVNAQNRIDTIKNKKILDPYWEGRNSKYFNPEQIDFSNEYFNLQKKRFIKNKNILNQLLKYDFSTIWLRGNISQNGVIGKNNQRIQIHIDSVYKSINNDKTYIVIGKSKVKENICDFKGEITIISVYIDKECDYSEFKNCGDLFASYIFYEDSTQYHSGIFKGITESTIYVDKKNKKVKLDESNAIADGYWNNTFVGTWCNYSGTISKKCIWGDYRLPFTFDFDCGDGEMHPCEKYINNGWKSFNDGSEWIRTGKDKYELKDKWWLRK